VSVNKTGAKGLNSEELLRRYFLRTGFFVIRGVPVKHEGVDLTDVDIWIYERPATLARRRIIVDIKDRNIPKAAERLFFVKGLAEAIGVEGAGVATTDARPALRRLARKQGLLWIDGEDIQRLKASAELANWDRLSEEELAAEVAALDRSRASRALREQFETVKSSVVSRFGASCANTSLEGAGFFAREVVAAHPGSESAKLLLRLSYFSASITAAALDFASADGVLRPTPERIRSLTESIRYGDDADGAMEKLRFVDRAIRDYAPNGPGLAKVVQQKFMADLAAIPAESFAEIVLKMARGDVLFEVARTLESAAYSENVPSFDDIEPTSRGFLGAVLDFVGIDRPAFARSIPSAGHAREAAPSSAAASVGPSSATSTEADGPKPGQLL
jgi:hypothetical protein